ncbi:MAG: HD domain-containing protein [Candidatus Thorarchaeota archaeon]|nr:HD domain-containing protein [Candidatus Thorarchaeota archaeon]
MFSTEKLQKQILFLKEIDDLKQIFRQTVLTKDQRQENDAEHSWHLAMVVIVLSEYSNLQSFDILKTVKMALIHDLVEIDAGDTFCYDTHDRTIKTEREREAAHRIFGLLPKEQAKEFIDLWEEFEEMNTSEACFAASVDRLQPLLLNFYSEGYAWRKHGVKKSQVIERNHHIAEGSSELWRFAEALIDESVKRGYLLDG